MTAAEEKQIQYLNQQVQKIQEENDKFKQRIEMLFSKTSEQVEKKHAPIYFENDILASVQSAMSKAIEDTLKGYNSPLNKLIQNVVESRASQLREIVTSAFDAVISLPEFKSSIVTAFSHKVAKSIISNNDGLFDKVANELKQDAIFKSKMSIAVSNVVEECLREKESNN
jgi:C4-type Zn-finger protein